MYSWFQLGTTGITKEVQVVYWCSPRSIRKPNLHNLIIIIPKTKSPMSLVGFESLTCLTDCPTPSQVPDGSRNYIHTYSVLIILWIPYIVSVNVKDSIYSIC